MSLLEAIILGIVQGLTEFLPVSSSGHIEIGKVLLNINVKDPLLFSIVVHGATALSTIVIFRKDIVEIFKGLFSFKSNFETQFALKIIISMIPVGIVGLLFEEQIEEFFEGNMILVGFMLILTAILLYITTIVKVSEKPVGYKHAIVSGLAQAVAILPGVSRSGATISTLLIMGVDREKAARFSFLMVLPPIMGALLLKVKKYLSAPEITDQIEASGAVEISTMALIAGFAAAFLAGLFACKWMIQLVKRSKLNYFAYYCLIVGLIAVISSFVV